ncbi:MAG TPA: hypothetical protein VF881_19120 [Polyangiaceae bacterium]
MCGRVRAGFRGMIGLVVVACSGSDESRPASLGDDPAPRSAEDAARPTAEAASEAAVECVSFESRECVIDLGVVNGVHNCTKGIQVCESGQWTPCAEPEL